MATTTDRSVDLAVEQNDDDVELASNLERVVGAKACAITVSHPAGVALTVGREDIVEVALLLRDDNQLQFISLIDICGVDYPERQLRFEVVYHLLSPVQNQRLRLKVAVDDAMAVPSLVEVYPAANWYEREAYDMYGILFNNHPDMRRILTDYGFDGHPLRKDFPLSGFLEVQYDDKLKRVVYEPVTLNQEFRNFDFASPWKGYDESSSQHRLANAQSDDHKE